MVLLTAYLAGCSTAHEKKIAVCRADRFAFDMKAPSGSHYRMLLGVPCDGDCEKRIPSPPAFEGHIIVMEGDQPVYDFSASAAAAARCNWLERKGQYGYLLTWGQTDELKKRLKPRHRYTVRVDFSTAPPRDTSVWLSWLTGT